ncbi:hypothetical protein BDN72DRAFT_143859 [Pluteus cervinus]|uniref:Uncharacterized protein n=1 Tax=Pluteus cervinus TaxID=181527 RepID=A0ACD3AM11_9AGAR|nr:hypothetical protein BDN72DRAFT_143859 [Pluteus cervinus]
MRPLCPSHVFATPFPPSHPPAAMYKATVLLILLVSFVHVVLVLADQRTSAAVLHAVLHLILGVSVISLLPGVPALTILLACLLTSGSDPHGPPYTVSSYTTGHSIDRPRSICRVHDNCICILFDLPFPPIPNLCHSSGTPSFTRFFFDVFSFNFASLSREEYQ